ncbi:MAG: PTS sugar transporter subunit IIC [Desulfuromonadaceae bacterium]|nr:PTS sugar transporter subunit IIC [Desulfuromonas sp.]MDY0184689.1 PTS sugar transporter subunit IIC [Desulfuromonadaceae bacterium]
MTWATDLSATQWLLLMLLSVLSGLDRTALAQSMLCRPVVCGCLCGLIMGNYAAGLLLGAAMELLWIMRLPVGAAIAPDDTQSTIAAVFLFCGLSPQIAEVMPEQVLLLALLFFAAAFSPLGRLIEIGARHLNDMIECRVQNKLASIDTEKAPYPLGWLPVTGLINFSVASLFSQVVILCATLASIVCTMPLLAALPWHKPNIMVYAAFLVGVAAVYALNSVRYSAALFGAGFSVTFLLTQV